MMGVNLSSESPGGNEVKLRSYTRTNSFSNSDMNTEVDVRKPNYLRLKSEDGSDSRYAFRLDSTHFRYYSVNNFSKPEGEIDIRNITKISPIFKENDQTSFQICTPGYTYVLIADNLKKRDLWVRALTNAIIEPFSSISTSKEKLRKSVSLDDLDSDKSAHLGENISYETVIIGGNVIKRPIKRPTSMSVKQKWQQQPCKKEGWCWKQGALVKNWKKRFFRLDDENLSYYETSAVVKEIRLIKVNTIRGVKILERYDQRTNLLEVETPKRKFYMQPVNSGELENWKEVLEKVISNGAFIPRTKSV